MARSCADNSAKTQDRVLESTFYEPPYLPILRNDRPFLLRRRRWNASIPLLRAKLPWSQTRVLAEDAREAAL